MSGGEFNPATQTRRTALSWDKESKPRIDGIREALKSRGIELSNRHLFLLCLGLGWKLKLKPGVPPRASDSVRVENLVEQDWALFNAVAMADEGGFAVLSTRDGVLDIVESYAAGGLRHLVEIHDANQSLVDALSQKIWPEVQAWNPSED